MGANRKRYPGYSRLLLAKGGSGQISIPKELMPALRDGLMFKPELTDDGILLRFVDEATIAAPPPMPSWLPDKKE